MPTTRAFGCAVDVRADALLVDPVAAGQADPAVIGPDVVGHVVTRHAVGHALLRQPEATSGGRSSDRCARGVAVLARRDEDERGEVRASRRGRARRTRRRPGAAAAGPGRSASRANAATSSHFAEPSVQMQKHSRLTMFAADGLPIASVTISRR